MSIRREKQTIYKMMWIYCRDHHHPKSKLCRDCHQMLKYAFKRLDRCPYKEAKPACAKCPIHCYNKEMRLKVKEVMRYSGPKMAFASPWLTICHFANKFRKIPKKN